VDDDVTSFGPQVLKTNALVKTILYRHFERFTRVKPTMRFYGDLIQQFLGKRHMRARNTCVMFLKTNAIFVGCKSNVVMCAFPVRLYSVAIAFIRRFKKALL